MNKPIVRVTERQGEIINLIVTRGCSNKQIGRALNLSVSAVKVHVSNILKKYGARTRSQLIVFFPSMKTEVYKINQPRS
jgi:DNA-binding NarL/FixJ family response regulator